MKKICCDDKYNVEYKILLIDVKYIGMKFSKRIIEV